MSEKSRKESTTGALKKTLRSKALLLRKKIATKRIVQLSRAIERNLIKVDSYRKSTRVVFFVSKKNEIDTSRMIKRKIKTACVLVPKVSGRRIVVYRIRDFKKDLSLGTFKIMEPNERAVRETIRHGDIAIVPALLYDTRGHRIGYGGGYYDRFLKKIKKPNRIGIIYSKFLIKKIPSEKHDTPVGVVVTEKSVLRAPRVTQVKKFEPSPQIKWRSYEDRNSCAGRIGYRRSDRIFD